MGDLISLFPSGSTLDDGMLMVGGCRADDLADEFGTPVLVVAESALRARAREYVDELAVRWAQSRVVFASKAFPCTAVQRVMVEEGVGLDVAGGGEILTALKAGVDPRLVVLHGNAKTDEEIALAVEHGVGLVVVDNADDVDRLEAIVPDGASQDVLVRIIPGVTADTHSHVLTGHEGSKFGLSPRHAAPLIQRIERSREGPDAGAARPCRLTDPRHRTVRRVGRAGRRARRVPGLRPGWRPRCALHVGRRAADDRCLPRRSRRRREGAPARRGAAHHRAGSQHGLRTACTIYRVTTVKRGAITFVAVDGGMGDNLEVALFQQRFEAGIVGRFGGPGNERVTVVGRHCESGDVLIDDVDLSSPAVGDLLAVPATGAYCYTMANNYNGSRRIPVVFAGDGAARLVVRRETWDDLMARDVDPA